MLRLKRLEHMTKITPHLNGTNKIANYSLQN